MRSNRESLIDWIDSADSSGRVTCIAPAWWLDKASTQPLQVKARAALDSVVYSLGLWKMLAFSTTKSEKDIALSGTLLENGDIELGFNLAQGFCLPMVDPSTELAEMKSFLQAMKPVYERTNSSGDAVQGVVRFEFGNMSVGTVNDSAEEFEKSDLALTENLRQMVDASKTLQSFLNGVNKRLHKIQGSWFYLRESEIFGRDNGPYEKAMFALAVKRVQAKER